MAWEIDAIHSHVAFSVRHLMVSTVRGRFNVLRGQLNIDEHNLANSWVEAEVDAASIDTQNEQRDVHLRAGDFFETDKYPIISSVDLLLSEQHSPIALDVTTTNSSALALYQACGFQVIRKDSSWVLRTNGTENTEVER